MSGNNNIHGQDESGRTFRMACGPAEHALARTLLEAQGYAFRPEPFSDIAFALDAEPAPLGGSLANTFGLIYIQDRSSMLPPLMLAPRPGEAVLDMCASPGGKTSLLSLLVGPEGFVIGNEPNRTRLETLRRNLHRMNAVNAATCSFPGEEIPLPDGSFNCILLDPPCSGWGTVDKNPNVMQIWGAGKTEPLEKLQRQLLKRAVELLAPGGRLMYSTCTTNPLENETQADFALRELGLTLDPMEHPAGFTVDTPTMRHLDGVLRVGGGNEGGQGFFLARFVKPGRAEDVQPESHVGDEMPGRPLSAAERTMCAEAGADLAGLPSGEVYRFGDNAYFLHSHALRIIPGDMRWQGFPVGRFAGRKFKPDARLRALLPAYDASRYVDAQSPDDILSLLSGQSIAAPSRGSWAGLAFRGVPLARLAVKGTRALWSDR
ncbi:16S rRNA (cytosine1407-C5)-methyltransferase [Desulfobaculum xiamenense]|uniref:16S rRNA (Cytosine1407-C5)-methyltransferase n=1 Tax=Desulfobaculum xiamenense TaxID=995050 RepID=A0A846QLW2_9BACT|nr:RsmB/NOP family class I SAM-dependent RNA methyltransferase [Desulfobaculum xiamenense]NJB68020.1 16S rRNA (cytosine1407-C5)-methyltransferase [Desulfobaculum xiamenense]